MPLHTVTPLLESAPLSRIVERSVWLKVESMQPATSFKLRGMGLAAERAVASGATRLVRSSGGNAVCAVGFLNVGTRKMGVWDYVLGRIQTEVGPSMPFRFCSPAL